MRWGRDEKWRELINEGEGRRRSRLMRPKTKQRKKGKIISK